MKSVVLSKPEVEYVAVSEVVKEIKFLYQMLRSMEIKVPLPIKVQVDNVRAIWLDNNSSVSERTTFKNGIWKLEALSDSDFANAKDTRYSVYGYIIYFCGIPVAWKSKSMKSVVLSKTEAEYVAVSEVVKEIKFLYQMLRSMEIKVPLPIMVQVYNVGAIWLANNSSVSERTKHVDLRAHFVRDMIKDQVIELKFVKSAENDSDIMTKNQQGQHYLYAKSKLVYTVPCEILLLPVFNL